MKKYHFKRIFSLACFVFICIGNIYAGKPKEFPMELICTARPDYHFQDVQKSLVITAGSTVSNDEIYDVSQLKPKLQKTILKKVKLVFTPTTDEFVNESVKKFVRASGISQSHDKFNDYDLQINLKELKIYEGETSGTCTAVIQWALLSPERQVVLDGVARGRSILSIGQAAVDVLDRAYSMALKDIDWFGISKILGVGNNNAENSKTSDQEKVKGEGNTSLEHTVIRWYIISTPAGADVSWRVVSSSPDVRNTNANYLGTTPYESTESFDIKGLTKENAGNVQVEITCERLGYLPQKKRFNLLQAIDQREISAKFNLVKEIDDSKE